MGFIRRYQLRRMTSKQLQYEYSKVLVKWDDAIAQGIDTISIMREMADIERIGKERNISFAFMD